jgi:hypothetical protein
VTDKDEDEDEDEDMEADEPQSMNVDVGGQRPKQDQESTAQRHWEEWNTFGSSGSRPDYHRLFSWQPSSTGVKLEDDGCCGNWILTEGA